MFTGTYHAIASAPISHVETCGVRKRLCTRPRTLGNADWLAIDNVVRDEGMIVVWVEAIAEVMIARTTSLSRPPGRTSSAIVLKIDSSSSNSASSSSPAYETTATVTKT